MILNKRLISFQLPNAAYELIVKDMPRIDLKVFKKKDLTGNDIGHLIGRAEVKVHRLEKYNTCTSN